MVLKLYGHPIFICTKRIAYVLREKQVPYELITVDVPGGEHKTAAFRKFQPFGLIPYIDDDGLIIYESRAICRYIAEKWADQGTELIPRDLAGRGLFEQAAAIEAFNWDLNATGIIAEKLFKPFRGEKTDEDKVKQLLATLDPILDVYEGILTKQKYVAGDKFTLADIFHVPVAVQLLATGLDVITSRPNLNRWYQDITSRPAWTHIKDVIPVDGTTPI